MGLPLSRFQMLSRLCARDEYVREKFAHFKLTCIVLHDPDDGAFTRQMKNRFPALHQQTGESMLFVTFVNPPKSWRFTGRENFNELESRNLEAERGFDSWLIIQHLMPVIAPDENLPCLILTDDLLSGDYVLMKTSTEGFERQLLQLGRYCSASESRFRVSDSRFQSFLSGLGPSHLCHLVEGTVAKAFADVLALHDLQNDNKEAANWVSHRTSELQTLKDSASDSETKSRAEWALFRYQSSAKRMREHEPMFLDSDHAIELRNDETYLGAWDPSIQDDAILPHLYERYYLRPKQIKGYELCHVSSRGNIREFNESLPSFVRKESWDEVYSFYSEDELHPIPRSFKSLARPLTEFFEREINMTLVQLMRFNCGIEMPKYYRKFKRGTIAYIKTRTDGRVALNACEYPDKWVPIMLGPAYYAYRSMSERNGEYYLTDRMGEAFLNEWYHMIKYRNMVSHADYSDEDYFGYEAFSDFFLTFSSILENSLWKMECIGQSLRTGNGIEIYQHNADDLFGFVE